MFLAGGILFAAVLVGVPIWLHRMRRHAGERQVFASLRLMRGDDLPPRSEPRLRYLLLMALRILVIIAAVFAFARPAIEQPPIGTTGAAARLIVVDTSFSMSAEDVMDEARDIVSEVAANAAGPVSLALANGQELQLRVRDGTLAEVRNAASRMSAVDTRLTFAALATQVGAMVSTLGDTGSLEVHLVSDFQQSGMPEQFNRLLQQASWRLVLHPVGGADAGNVSVESLSVRGRGPTVEVRVGVRSRGSIDGRTELTLRSDDTTVRVPIALAPGALTYHTVSIPVGSAITASVGASGVLLGDEVRRVTRHEAQNNVTVIAEAGEGDSGTRFLTTAFESVGVANVQTVPPDTIGRLGGEVLVAVDPASWSPAAIRALRDRVRGGASVFVTAGAQTRRAGRMALPDLSVSASRLVASRSRVVAVDGTHPLLAGLGAGDIEVYHRVYPVDAPAGRIILATEDGRPFLVEYPMGAGRALVLMTAADPAWSSFVVDAAFVRFTENLVHYLAGGVLPAAVDAGAPLRLEAPALQIFDADGTRMLGLAGMSGQRSISLDTVGFYTVHTAGTRRMLAVNTPVAESDLTPAPPDVLERWQTAQAGAGQPNGSMTPGSLLEFAPWLFAFLALLAVAESALANMTARAGIRADPVDNGIEPISEAA